MSNMSLMSIMRDDPDFGRRMTKKIQNIKEDKAHLCSAADEYNKRYEQEVLAGTELRAKLLTEGSSKGLSEAEVMSSYGKFVPTIYTPIMNMLYFLLRESEPQDSAHYRKRDAINEALVKAGQVNHDEGEPELTSAELNAILDERLKELHEETMAAEERKKVNSQFDQQKNTRTEKASLKETPEMVEYLYGNITLDTFNKIKKLKALSKSPNKQEAFLAYTKACEMCKQYNLDFDRIPCYVQGEDE